MTDLAERLKDAYEFACLETAGDPTSNFWENAARWWEKNGKW